MDGFEFEVGWREFCLPLSIAGDPGGFHADVFGSADVGFGVVADEEQFFRVWFAELA